MPVVVVEVVAAVEVEVASVGSEDHHSPIIIVARRSATSTMRWR